LSQFSHMVQVEWDGDDDDDSSFSSSL
jgi:hypothetical protein